MAVRRFEVIGEHKIGPDGVGKGGVVELDDEVYNIGVLIDAGHVRELAEGEQPDEQPDEAPGGRPTGDGKPATASRRRPGK